MACIDTHRAAYNRPNPSLKCGKKKDKPRSKSESTTAFFMRLSPHYTNNTALFPVKPEELSEAKKIYPKGSFLKITTVTTTTFERV